MIIFTIRFMNPLLLLLSLALILPELAASTSAIARSSPNKRSIGFRILPDDLTPDFFKRQEGTSPPATTAAPATVAVPPPASPPVTPPATTAVPPPASPPDTPPSSASSTIQSPPSSPSTPVVPPPPPPSDPSSSTPVVSPPSPPTVPSSSSSIPVVSPPPTDPSSSSSSSSTPVVAPPTDPSSSSSSQSDALLTLPLPQPDSPLQTPSPSGSSQSDSSIQSSSSSSSSQSDSLIQTPLPLGSSSISSPGGSAGASVTNTGLPAPSESIGNGTASTSLSDAVITGGSTAGGGSTIAGGSISLSPQATPLGNLSQNDTSLPSSSDSSTTSSSTSYALSYEFATLTGPGGAESISIGTVSVSQAVVPVTTDPAIAAAPLEVQQALPDTPPTPVCQLQYLPGNAWQTTSTGPADNTTSTNGTTTTFQGPAIVPQCNNGTRISNIAGSQINLKFVGTEVFLLMVPGVMGGAYDVKIDDGDVETVDNYKAGVTSCQVARAWNRTNLENKPHDITVIVKGAPAGSAGGTQVEFSGLIFKGPKTNPDSSSGPNWIIIGASIGAGVVVLALIFIGVLCIRRRRAQRATPTPVPRPPSAVSSFRPQTLVSNHTRAGSAFSGAGTGVGATQAGPGHHRADSNFSNAPSGHYRGDSGFSGTPYDPTSPLSQLQQNPFGHSRQQSDVPLMGQQAPWQIPATGVANVPPSGSPYHSNMSSPQSRPLAFVGYNNGQERQSMAGYGNGQERQSMASYGNGQERQSMAAYGNGQERQPFVQTHGRETSYGSDIRNPFE